MGEGESTFSLKVRVFWTIGNTESLELIIIPSVRCKTSAERWNCLLGVNVKAINKYLYHGECQLIKVRMLPLRRRFQIDLLLDSGFLVFHLYKDPIEDLIYLGVKFKQHS